MYLTFELDLEMVNMIQLAEHLGQRSFSSKCYCPYAHRHAHTGPIAKVVAGGNKTLEVLKYT